jgi:hypothetical protein
MKSYKRGGLKTDKYIILKNKKGGPVPVDKNAEYFVLRIDADPHARKALHAYADSVESDNQKLAKEIRSWLWLYRNIDI